MNTDTLFGKAALVTGGSRSIGAAIARRLARAGAAVAITFNGSPDQAAALVDEIRASGGRAVALRADAADPEAVRAAVQGTVAAFGALDILVNNAGIALYAPIGEVVFADYERTIAVNVTGVFAATHEALRHMGEGGRIINIGSAMTRHAAFPAVSVYTLSKGAITAFSRGLVRDLGPRGITVNTVIPGPIETDLNPADGPLAPIIGPKLAVGRTGAPKRSRPRSPSWRAPRPPSSPAPSLPSTAASRPDLDARGAAASRSRPGGCPHLPAGFFAVPCHANVPGGGIVR